MVFSATPSLSETSRLLSPELSRKAIFSSLAVSWETFSSAACGCGLKSFLFKDVFNGFQKQVRVDGLF